MTGAAPQWVPTDEDVAEAQVTDFARFVGDRFGVETTDYQSLWQWSTDEPAAFWAALWDYFEFGDRPDTVLESESMPGARWFPGRTAELRRPGPPQCAPGPARDRPCL